MRNRPTADELAQEFAELEKAYALANTEAKHALEQNAAAAINPKLITTFKGTPEPWKNEVADNFLHAFVVANDKRDEAKRAMTKVRKQAWKWYRVVL